MKVYLVTQSEHTDMKEVFSKNRIFNSPTFVGL